MSFLKEIDSRMCDFTDFYDRIAVSLPNNCRVVECGVADGYSALYLADRLNSLGKVFKLYMVENMDYGGHNQMNTIWRNICNSGLSKHIEVIPKDSILASDDFNDNSLDFIFLDSSHQFLETRKEILAWYPKLKDDCYLSGHDYFSAENPGVKKAVDMMLPKKIKRKTINDKESGHYQEFQEHQFLNTYETLQGNGIWEVSKVFYWQPTLKK